jgi:hypothetical protein
LEDDDDFFAEGEAFVDEQGALEDENENEEEEEFFQGGRILFHVNY